MLMLPCEHPLVRAINLLVGTDGVDTEDDNADATVLATDGRVFSLTLHTPRNVVTLFDRWTKSGEESRYWVPFETVIVPELSAEAIRAAILAMADRGDLDRFGRTPQASPR